MPEDHHPQHLPDRTSHRCISAQRWLMAGSTRARCGEGTRACICRWQTGRRRIDVYWQKVARLQEPIRVSRSLRCRSPRETELSAQRRPIRIFQARRRDCYQTAHPDAARRWPVAACSRAWSHGRSGGCRLRSRAPPPRACRGGRRHAVSPPSHQWPGHDQALNGLLASKLGDAQGLADHGRARQREQQAHGMQLPGPELPHSAPQLRTQRTLPGSP